MTTGLKANSDGSAAIQVGGTDVITLTSGGAATFVTSPTTVQAGTAAAPSITFSGDTNTGIYSPGADTWAVATGGTERLRVDSAGNAGLGVTPSAWGAGYKAIQISTNGVLYNTSGNNYFGSNVYNDGTNLKRITTAAVGLFGVESGNVYKWYQAASDTAGTNITLTTAMTLDASGNFGVGTSSPANKLHVVGTAASNLIRAQAASSGDSVVLRPGAAGNGGDVFSVNDAQTAYTPLNVIGSTVVFLSGTGGTERARITSGGYFKASDNGTYASATGLYHELKQSAQDYTVIVWGTNASLTSPVQEVYASRSATSAYTFIQAYSSVGGTADREFQLRGDGNAYADGTWNNNGADYAEYFESSTGAALTLGATVVLDGNKVREATDQDPVSAIMGVVRPKEPSKASMVVGNTAWNKWANKYLTDDFDRFIMEDHNVLEWTDGEGKLQTYESHSVPADVIVPDNAVVKTHDDKGNKFQHYKLNPAWNPDAEYVNRENRPEWIIVGLVGQVKVLKGQPVNDRWIKMRDVSATVEEWMIR